MSRADVSESVKSRRREVLWAWLSLVTLLIAWDRAARLDEPASVPRVRLAQALDREEKALAAATARALNDRGLRTR